jgi:hypothetical protein
MQSESWLRLADYANKYHVSISTLRRRIKNGNVQYRFDDGRYLLRDEGSSFVDGLEAAEVTGPQEYEPMKSSEEPILSSANGLLSELKRAYTSILQEREEQIIHLKEEVSDLKTLVRVLEDDNERLRRINSRSF